MKIPTLKKLIKKDEAVSAPQKKAAPKKIAIKKVAPAKKVAVKKATTKKAVASKKSAGTRLVVASDSESFWVTDGQVLNSMVTLADAFKTMPKEVYAYHISSSGSDFADWVESILDAPECAKALRKAKTAKAAYTVVANYLK